GPVQAKFEKIQSGSLPPKITHVSSEASPQDRFIVYAKLETRDLSFVVFASQQTHEGVKLTNVTASVLRLKGTLRVQAYTEGADVKVSFNFEGKPEIKVEVKPLNSYQEASELVDLGALEANVRNSIILAKTTFVVTHLLMPGDLQTAEHDRKQEQERELNFQNAYLPSRDIQKQQKQTLRQQNTAPQPSFQQKQQLQLDQEIQVASVAPTTNTAPPIHSISVQNEPSIPVRPINNRLQQEQQQLLQKQIQQVPRRDQQKVRPQARPEGLFEPVETAYQQSSLFSTPSKPPRMIGDKRLLVKVIKANGLTVKEIGGANCVCMISTDEPIQGYSTSIVKNTQNPFWDEHFLFDITHDTQEVRVEIYDKDQFIGEAIVYVEDLRKTPSSRQILRLHPQPGNFEYNSGTVTAEFLFMDPSEADLLLDSMTTTANNQLSPRGTVVTKTTTTTQRPQYGRHDPGFDSLPTYIEKNIADEAPRLSFTDSPANVSSGMQQQLIPTIESSPAEDTSESPQASQQQPTNVKDKKKGGFGSAILKRFGRKKRAHSADRATSSMREGDYLRPPEPSYGPQSKDDLELVRLQAQEGSTSPNLKKSRTLGGSLKKLFRRSRKQSKSRADSRESSLSRGSRSKGPSRDNSLSRQSQRESEQRESSIS
ncbi:unnamed protein product, partial [Candidula unifasciata]